MQQKRIGFIGCGNMAKAIIGGIVSANIIPSEHIMVFDHKPATNQLMEQQYGITAAKSLEQLTQQADILFAAVKPNVILEILEGVTSHLKEGSLIISIAAGVTLEQLESVLGHDRKIIRLMPNTPALVGQAMTSVTPNRQVSEQETEQVVNLCRSFGLAEIVKESLIHAVVGVSGSAPAYIFILLEAMADAAVRGGMPRAQAYQFAAQAVKGSAQMLIESGKHPGELKDMVCSPGGTTIEAVKSLEEKGFRGAIIEAISQCMEKSKVHGQ